MKAHIKNGTLFIEVPCDCENPRTSKSGLTRLVASETQVTDVVVKGQSLKVQVNAMIKV